MNLLRIVLLGLAAILIGLLGWQIAVSRGPSQRLAQTSTVQPASAAAIAQERPAIEAAMAQATEFSSFFTALKSDFPSDYNRLLDNFAAQAVARGHVETPEIYLSQALRNLRQTRGKLAARAAPDPLAHIFDMQSKVMAAMAAVDPRLCVDFFYGGASPAFFDFAAQHRALVADMAQAGLDAVVSGQTAKVGRAAPTDADFDQFQAALEAQGLNAIEISALLDGKAPDPPIADERMCQVGRTYLDVMQALPDDPRLKIYALAVELGAGT